jgi:arginine decarboxylase-like protein
MLLSERKYVDSLFIVREFAPNTSNNVTPELELTGAWAELHLGRLISAHQRITNILTDAKNGNDREEEALAALAESAVLLAEKSPLSARDQAQQARQYFHETGKKESEMVSLYYLATCQRELREKEHAQQTAQSGIDILSGWEQSWDSSLYHSYLRRPDIREISKGLHHYTNSPREEFR